MTKRGYIVALAHLIGGLSVKELNEILKTYFGLELKTYENQKPM